MVIEVWASWCGDCVKAMPKIKELQADAYASKKVGAQNLLSALQKIPSIIRTCEELKNESLKTKTYEKYYIDLDIFLNNISHKMKFRYDFILAPERGLFLFDFNSIKAISSFLKASIIAISIMIGFAGETISQTLIPISSNNSVNSNTTLCTHAGCGINYNNNADGYTVLSAVLSNTITFFPSYTLHDVTAITKGTRKALVGWVLGPRWK